MHSRNRNRLDKRFDSYNLNFPMFVYTNFTNEVTGFPLIYHLVSSGRSILHKRQDFSVLACERTVLQALYIRFMYAET
jgi:hypothetical protein